MNPPLCQADLRPAYEHAAEVARERAANVQPVAVPVGPPLELAELPVEPSPPLTVSGYAPEAPPPPAPRQKRERTGPHGNTKLQKRTAIATQTTADGSPAYVAHVRCPKLGKVYIGRYADLGEAIRDCETYIGTGAKPEPKQRGRKLGQTARRVPKRLASALKPVSAPVDSAEGVPTAARAEFMARRLVMIREVARRGA